MKKVILVLIILLLNNILLFSQKLMRSYWDWRQSSVKEEYYVNSKGEKNGAYKAYDENGVVAITGTMKNGLWNGLVTTYSTSTGRQSLESKETWKDGLKDGPAEYWRYDVGGSPDDKGNYKSDQKEGVWIVIRSWKGIFADIPEEEKKCCAWIKYQEVYKDGVKQPEDGKVTWTYFPSGKLCQEINYSNGEKVGNAIGYHPNGQLRIQIKRDSLNVLLLADEFDEAGKIVSHYDRETDLAEHALKAKQDSLEEIERQRQIEEKDAFRNRGDSALSVDNYEFAIACYKQSDPEKRSDLEQQLNNLKEANDLADKKQFEIAIKNYNYISENVQSSKLKQQLKEKVELVNEYSSLNNRVLEKIDIYYNSFVEVKDAGVEQVPSMMNGSVVGYYNKPVTKEKYIKGEYLYKKSRQVIDLYLSDFNSVKIFDRVKVQKSTTVLIDACDKMIQISTGETKDLNTQLKKVESVDEIKSILGI